MSVNGVDIWEKIKACKPNLILLDIHMQDISGEMFCEMLKKKLETSQIPVLMYSSNRNIEAVAKRCGADGYIEKSCSPKEVKDRLMQYVQMQ